MKKTNLSLGNSMLYIRKKFYPFLTRTCLVALLLFSIVAGCKKVTENAGVTAYCPVVVSTDPMDKAVDVALNKVVSATFNTDLNPASINSSSFYIKQGTQIISGTVAATSVGSVYTFTPDIPFLPFAIYTGTITNAATDKFRTAMVSNYVWSFTTIPQVSLSVNLIAGGTVLGGGTFAQGSTVTMSATPKSGFSFINWTDSASGIIASTSSGFTFKMAGNRSLVANFSLIPPAQFALVLSSLPLAGGATFGSGSYNTGTLVTAIESPSAGYTFTNWTESGTIVSTNSSFQFAITGNRTLVANFSAIPALQFAVILTSNPAQGGTTTGSGSYNSGTSLNISATPAIGYTFVNWTDNATGTIVSASALYTFNVVANRSLIANFAINTYTLTGTAINGVIVKNPNQINYNYGTQVQLTATPNPGYSFTSWSGDASGNTNPLLITMNANKNITANFTQNAYTLTIASVNGTVVKNPNQLTYNSGTSVQLTATPNAGFVFTSWSGDTAATSNPLTVVMNSNKNLNANFSAIAPAIALGTAANFGAIGGNAGLTNQGLNTIINNGNIGTTAASTLVTGFHDGLTGDVYTETPLNVGNSTGGIFAAPPAPGTATSFTIAQKAMLDANIAYLSISPASKPGGIDPGAGELGGLTLAPGIYKSASGTFNISNGNLTLDAQGDPNAVWIFQTASGLTVGIAGPSGARSVIMINQAQPKNVFWYVGSAATINGAGGGVMVGTIIANSGVSFSTAGNTVQTVLNGRALSLIASVTMVNTTINNQ